MEKPPMKIGLASREKRDTTAVTIWFKDCWAAALEPKNRGPGLSTGMMQRMPWAAATRGSGVSMSKSHGLAPKPSMINMNALTGVLTGSTTMYLSAVVSAGFLYTGGGFFSWAN